MIKCPNDFNRRARVVNDPVSLVKLASRQNGKKFVFTFFKCENPEFSGRNCPWRSSVGKFVRKFFSWFEKTVLDNFFFHFPNRVIWVERRRLLFPGDGQHKALHSSYHNSSRQRIVGRRDFPGQGINQCGQRSGTHIGQRGLGERQGRAAHGNKLPQRRLVVTVLQEMGPQFQGLERLENTVPVWTAEHPLQSLQNGPQRRTAERFGGEAEAKNPTNRHQFLRKKKADFLRTKQTNVLGGKKKEKLPKNLRGIREV